MLFLSSKTFLTETLKLYAFVINIRFFYFYLFISSWEFPVTKTNDRKIKVSKVKKILFRKHALHEARAFNRKTVLKGWLFTHSLIISHQSFRSQCISHGPTFQFQC